MASKTISKAFKQAVEDLEKERSRILEEGSEEAEVIAIAKQITKKTTYKNPAVVSISTSHIRIGDDQVQIKGADFNTPLLIKLLDAANFNVELVKNDTCEYLFKVSVKHSKTDANRVWNDAVRDLQKRNKWILEYECGEGDVIAVANEIASRMTYDNPTLVTISEVCPTVKIGDDTIERECLDFHTGVFIKLLDAANFNAHLVSDGRYEKTYEVSIKRN